ncbi:MAG: type IV pilus assembly protein FimV [Gammaproteobacteria bacterium]
MMNRLYNPVIVDDETENADVQQGKEALFLGKSDALLSPYDLSEDPYLSGLVNEIKRKPNGLRAHVRRIYWCYREQLAEALYAALVDFLIVLNHKGQALAERMVLGSGTLLLPEQQRTLNTALKARNRDMTLLTGNRFSVFSKGLEGRVQLIEKIPLSNDLEYDPLQLAEDAIHYSQLDEAMDILEDALRDEPERLPLHQTLLVLYKSTYNRARFEQMAAAIEAEQGSLPEAWSQLREYFEEHPSRHAGK